MFIAQAYAATEVAEHGEKGAFPPFDPTYFASQLLWLTLTFGLFYLVTAKVIIPRLAGILEDRRGRISRDLDETQRLKDEADSAEAAYEHELAQAKANAHKIGTEATDKAKADAVAVREKVEAELADKMAEAEARIQTIKEEALGEVGTIAEEATESIVSQVLGGKLTKKEVADAVASVDK